MFKVGVYIQARNRLKNGKLNPNEDCHLIVEDDENGTLWCRTIGEDNSAKTSGGYNMGIHKSLFKYYKKLF